MPSYQAIIIFKVVNQAKLDQTKRANDAQTKTKAKTKFNTRVTTKFSTRNRNSHQVSRMNLLETESYEDVLSSGRRRKRPKLAGGVNDLSTLVATAEVRKREHETVSHIGQMSI